MKRIGIVAALAREGRTLGAAERGHVGDSVVIAIAGIGQDNAARAAQALVDQGVAGLVSWGTTGALDPALIPGTIVVGVAVHGLARGRFDCDPGWHARLRERLRPLEAVAGDIYSPDAATATRRDKCAARATSACAIVDLESAGIAALAARAGVPFAVVRCVVDPAHFDLPESALAAFRGSDRPRLAPLLGTLARHPGDLPALLRLAQWHGRALAGLERAARRLRPDFSL